LAIDEEATNFSFSDRGHEMAQFAADDVNGSVCWVVGVEGDLEGSLEAELR
jgi:hypothetical protein